MKGKSLVVQIFTLIISVITIYGNLVPMQFMPYLGIISFTLTTLLNSALLSSGTWPTGWGPVMWITNIVGVVIQVLNQLGETAMVEPVVVNYIIVGINLLLFTFVKDYGTQTSIVQKK